MKWRAQVLLSVGVGLAAGAFFLDLRPSAVSLQPVGRAGSSAPSITAANNKRPLTPHDRRRMLAWADTVRDCASGEVSLRVSFAENEVILRPLKPMTVSALVSDTARCAAKAGGPPSQTSFVAEKDGSMHLYKPRACLLPVRKRA